MAATETSGAFAASVRGYMDTPTMGVPPLASVACMREALDAWQLGRADYETWERDAEACRDEFAALLAVPPSDVGLLPSVVPGAAAVAATLARRGGTMVAHTAEFRSLLLPFLVAFGEDRVRWVEGPYTASTFLAGLRSDVTVVLVSSVSSADGGRPDLRRVLDGCASVGAAVVVDATQSLGPSGLGVPASRLAAVLCAGYKGLLAPRGTAYAYVQPDLLDGPPATPNPSGMADTPEVGPYGPPVLPKPGAPGLDQSLAWLSWVGALPALRLLAGVPERRREKHVTDLAARFREGLERLSLRPQETDLPSPVVSVEAAQPDQLVAALRAAGVRAASRRGRVRFGFHLYNTASDLEMALAVLDSSMPRSSDLRGG
jgi:selenocysteine lyase/cysteine desulfurase